MNRYPIRNAVAAVLKGEGFLFHDDGPIVGDFSEIVFERLVSALERREQLASAESEFPSVEAFVAHWAAGPGEKEAMTAHLRGIVGDLLREERRSVTNEIRGLLVTVEKR